MKTNIEIEAEIADLECDIALEEFEIENLRQEIKIKKETISKLEKILERGEK